MAAFRMPSISSNADMKKVYNYLQMLNQQLQYCFRGISPEDNFSLDAMVKYQATDEAIAQLEISMKGFLTAFKNLEEKTETKFSVMNEQIQLKVSAEDLCSEISMHPGTIDFKTGYITFDTKNFKLDRNGVAQFSGAITGGSININDNFIVDSSGKATLKSMIYDGSVMVTGPCHAALMLIERDLSVDGDISCNNMTVSGSVTAEEYFQTSDKRLKEDIQVIPDGQALSLVMGLKPVHYRYKGSGIKAMGFIAQEVNELQDKLGTDLPMTELGEDGYYGINYSGYTALIAGAIKAQQKQLEELERKLEEEV